MRVESACSTSAPLQAAPQPSYPLRLGHCIHPGVGLASFCLRGPLWVVWVVGVGWGFRVPRHTLARH